MTETADKEILVLLGMHRSGTSLLAQMARAGLGYDFGDAVLPAAADNPEGFYEDQEAVRLDDLALERLASHWNDARPLLPDAFAGEGLRDVRSAAANWLGERLGRYPRFAVKDPRMTVLAPFWSPLLRNCGRPVRVLAAVRDPLAVARSLQRRDGFPLAHGLLLWTHYNLVGLGAWREFGPLFVDYDRLLDQPSEQGPRIESFLEAAGHHETALPVRPELRHHRGRVKEAAEMPLPEPMETVRALLGRACGIGGPPPPSFWEEWDALLRRWLSWAPVFNWMEEILYHGRVLERRLSQWEDGGTAVIPSASRLRVAEAERIEMARAKAVLEERVASLQAQNQHLQRVALSLQEGMEGLRRGHYWRITRPFRALDLLLRGRVRETPFSLESDAQAAGPLPLARRPEGAWHMLRGEADRLPLIPVDASAESDETADGYGEYLRCYDTLSDDDRDAIRNRIRSFVNPPRFSVILPVFNAPEEFLRRAIESVRAQLYPHWELCIADDASTAPHVRRLLLAYKRKDRRIKVCFRERNGHISAASNSALAMANGEFVALLDHDDELSETALYRIAEEALAHPDAQLLYSDEDKLSPQGRRRDPYFKPDWNPDLLLGQNFVCHLGVYRRDRVEAIGGFREGFEGAQDWDLVLRFSEGLGPDEIRHIPAVLYHWRVSSRSTAASMEAKPYAVRAAERAVAEALARRGESARLEILPQGALFLPHFAVHGEPLVSIVVPTRDGVRWLRRCLESLERTDYPHREVLVIDNQSSDPETLDYLREIARHPGVRVLSYPYPFDFAAMHNWAVPQAEGEFVCLLNDDTEVRTPGWLREMLALAQRPGIGAVGAKLLYPDGTVQHAGVVLGIGGIAGHVHRYFPGDSCGYFCRANLVENYSAVTGACLLLKKSLWLAAEGLSPSLAVAYNDVDLCLRLREMGLRNTWTPAAVLIHHESRSRGPETDPEKQRRFGVERAYMQWRWGPLLGADPAYNPNLTLNNEDFSLGWPPRAPAPWKPSASTVVLPFWSKEAPQEAVHLEPGQAIQGSFRVPRHLSGQVDRVSLLVGNHGGRSDGVLRMDLGSDPHAIVFSGELAGSVDNAYLEMKATEGALRIDAVDRLAFSLRLENATHPVALWAIPLDEAWGNGIAGRENLALRVEFDLLA